MERIIKRALVAEDLSEWQKFHIVGLKSYDRCQMDFYIADNARAALKIAEEQKEDSFDVIITDLQMETEFEPEYAGEWLIKQLKQMKEYKDVPVIIVSAAYNIEFVANSLGCYSYSKRYLSFDPYRYDDMLDEVLHLG